MVCVVIQKLFNSSALVLQFIHRNSVALWDRKSAISSKLQITNGWLHCGISVTLIQTLLVHPILQEKTLLVVWSHRSPYIIH